MNRPASWLALSTVALTAVVNTAHGDWASDGIAVCTSAGVQLSPQLTSDGSGGAIIVWEDKRTPMSLIYAQRIDASGTPCWTADGVLVCPSQFGQITTRAVHDGTGGAIIVWEDVRSGVANKDLYVQRLDAAGTPLWNAAGVAICRADNDQSGPKLVSDGAGGAIIAWSDGRSGVGDIYAQRINAAGTPLWTADGVAVCEATDSQGGVELIADGSGGAVVIWTDFRTTATTAQDVYVQRINASGGASWTANGVAVCTAAGNQTGTKLISDGSGGALIAWHDNRTGTLDVYAQRISGSGALLWSADGVPVCTASGPQFNAQLTTDGAAGALVSWQDQRTGSADVYAQRLDETGNTLWATDGVGIATAADADASPSLVAVEGGAAITWQSVKPSGDSDVYAKRVGVTGNLDAPNAVCTAPHPQGTPRLIADGDGGAIITWDDDRGRDYDIYAQKLDGPTSITLQEFNAASSSGSVLLTWRLAMEALPLLERIQVQRALAAAGPWVDLASQQPSLSMSFEDTQVSPGQTYWYRLLLLGSDGVQASAPLSAVEGASAWRTRLYPPVENADGVVFRYALAVAGQTRLEILDVSGRRVRTLPQDLRPPGEYLMSWDRNGEAGTRVARGVYVVRLQSGAVATARKLILVR